MKELSRKQKKIILVLPILLALAVFAGPVINCGTESDIIGGVTAWPISGTKPWGKVDLDLKTTGLQPFIIQAEPGIDYVEPAILKIKGYYWIYFERRAWDLGEGGKIPTSSDILLLRSTDAFTYELYGDGEPLVRADLPWEEGFAGAPSVMWDGDHFVMWYAGGIGRGIGRATSTDGIHWDKTGAAPVMAPDQLWEDGVVGAPSVIKHEGLYRMYYSGGSSGGSPFAQFAGRLIGYADSEDGIHWAKRDVEGRNSEADGDGVFYVLGPSQAWEEGVDAGGDSADGAVQSPSALMTHPADRDVLLLYYTGNAPGDPVNHPMSVGLAAAFDYNTFTKASSKEVNPILNENFALQLYGISEYLSYSEFSPSVIQLKWDFFLMVFSQTDILSELGSAGRGLALATCPPLGSFAADPPSSKP